MDSNDLAREALDGLFRRRVAQAAVADAFERPGALRITPRGPCAVCHQRRRCIGTGLAGQLAR